MPTSTPDGYADADEVASYAHELRTSYLLCRELQHNWKPWSASWDDEHHNYVRRIRCTRCHTVKHQRVSRTGGVLASHYEYPDGYLHARLGRIVGDARDTLRLESLMRSINSPNLKAVE